MTIEERVLKSAEYFLAAKSTIRGTAKVMGVSKSTVFNDFRFRLPKINYALYEQVNELLRVNDAEKHIRGGRATKNKLQRRNRNVV